MWQDISKSSDRCLSRLLSLAKTIAKWIGTHPLYISYIIFFSPYILKLIYFLFPLLTLLLAAALCALSSTASTSNRYHVICDETHENASSTRLDLETEAYKTIFDTFHDSVTSLADESDEVEAYKQIKIETLAPEIVKSYCSSTPLRNPPLHETVAKTAICAEDELSTRQAQSEAAKSTICHETEIIKHMVCSTINEQDKHETEDTEQVKEAVKLETNIAESTPFTTTQKSGSNAAIDTTDLNKSTRSCDLSSIGSMRREKEWTRTLACKLFEERHNRGEDGMDMLWETYEEEKPIESPVEDRKQRRGTMSRRSSRSAKMLMESDRSIRVYADEDEGGDDDDDDDDVAESGKMCCLQALKMSSGKVNLGIKTKNMIKFSKVLRGFGWLHKTTSNANTRT